MSTTDTPAAGRLRLVLPETKIIPFPTARRVGKVRRIANQIHYNTRRGANYVWRRAVDDMGRQMERAGIPDERIEAELDAFRQAVQKELVRISYGHSNFDGGDAA